MNKEKFYKAMVKRFGCVPALTDYSSSLRNDISLDEALSLIPDDDVVLTKEEYEALLLEQKRLKEIVDRIPCGYVQKEEVEYWKNRCKEIGDVASKETAREIFRELKIELKGFIGLNYLDNLANKLGIEL